MMVGFSFCFSEIVKSVILAVANKISVVSVSDSHSDWWVSSVLSTVSPGNGTIFVEEADKSLSIF